MEVVMKLRNHLIFTVVTAVLLSLGTVVSAAQQKAVEPAEAAVQDDSWKFHAIVDVDFVMQNVKIPMPENVMIIDARPKRAKYDKGHIPMAISIPNTKFDKMTDKLPQDKDALLIFYCGGLKCKLSHKSAWKAEKLGYTNVKVFAKGFPAWMKVKGNYPAVSVEWVKKQIDKNADLVLVDSRPKRKKYDKGHIPTAISIPDTQFNKNVDKLPPEKDKLLVFYCGGFKCKLSHKSAKKAMDLGYTKVKVFAAGYPAWKAYAGADSIAKAGVTKIKPGKEEGSIDLDFFTKIVKQKPSSVYLIDVRDPDEFSTGSFKTAENIPVDKLEARIPSLPADKPIIFVCGTGARSGEAYYMVQDLRPQLKEVYYVEAEITIAKDGSFKLTEIIN
jgi:rhodanese-related sulfurtransferase